MTAVEWRQAAAEDAADIWAVRVSAIEQGCRRHYATTLLAKWLATPMPADFAKRVVRERYVLAVEAGRIVGFAGLKRAAAEVDAVFVHPDFFGQGLGARLLAEVESIAAGWGLEAVQLNASLNAVPFYRACGYAEQASGQHRSASGLDIPCVHMRKALEPATRPASAFATMRDGHAA